MFCQTNYAMRNASIRISLNFMSDNVRGIADGHCGKVGREVGGKLPIYRHSYAPSAYYSIYLHPSQPQCIPGGSPLYSLVDACCMSPVTESHHAITRGECAVPSVVHQFHSYQDHQHRMNALLRQTCAVSIVIKPSATIKALRQEQRTEPCIDSQREPATHQKMSFRQHQDAISGPQMIHPIYWHIPSGQYLLSFVRLCSPSAMSVVRWYGPIVYLVIGRMTCLHRGSYCPRQSQRDS
ncbi:hypothetical protein PILCRDRAFT_502145 [Piloderma croceum F 1598]|uniref:Uncharacterized protein n=1 Tax=Piloderma croceum (strain F 1598) TaxID=765440 RepID=A0A0C3FNW4_PILCF|nr:hypothetical protein PILCRDRAFT_502145 [Piloderma croceum F 1598]